MHPDRAVLLDPGDLVHWDGRAWSSPHGVRLLSDDGEVETVPSFVPGAPGAEPGTEGAAM